MELEKKRQFLITLCFWAAVLALCYLALRYLLSWLLPGLLGFLIAYRLRPAAAFVRRHSGVGPRAAAIIPAVLLYALLGLLLWGLGFLAVAQAHKLGEWFPRVYAQSVQPWLERLGGRMSEGASMFGLRAGSGAGGAVNLFSEALGSLAESASEWGVKLLGALASALPLLALTVVFTVLSSVIICIDYEAVTGFVLRQLPQRLRPVLLGVRDFLLQAVGRVLKTYLILMLITLAQLCVGLWLLRVESWPMIAAAIAVLDLLPVLGSGVVLVPWAAWRLAAGDYLPGGGLLALWVVVSAVRQLLEPKILGDQIGLPPLAALTSMYLGLRVGGVWGLVFAPVLCLLLRYLHDNNIVRLYR